MPGAASSGSVYDPFTVPKTDRDRSKVVICSPMSLAKERERLDGTVSIQIGFQMRRPIIRRIAKAAPIHTLAPIRERGGKSLLAGFSENCEGGAINILASEQSILQHSLGVGLATGESLANF